MQTACGETYSSEFRDEQTQELDTCCPRPDVSFTSDVFKRPASLTVHFSATSKNTRPDIMARTYMFGDAHSGHDQNPVHTIKTPGVYPIHQTVKKSCNPYGDESTLRVRVRPAVPAMNTSGTTTAVTTTTLPATRTTGSAVMTSRVPFTPSAAVAVQNVIAGAGTLSVTTDPAGAQVYVDDVLRGVSPATIPGLPAGANTLRLEREGYQTMRVPVTISDGKTTEYSTALIPVSSGRTSSVPPGAAAAVIASAGAGAYLYIRKKKTP